MQESSFVFFWDYLDYTWESAAQCGLRTALLSGPL